MERNDFAARASSSPRAMNKTWWSSAMIAAIINHHQYINTSKMIASSGLTMFAKGFSILVDSLIMIRIKQMTMSNAKKPKPNCWDVDPRHEEVRSTHIMVTPMIGHTASQWLNHESNGDWLRAVWPIPTVIAIFMPCGFMTRAIGLKIDSSHKINEFLIPTANQYNQYDSPEPPPRSISESWAATLP